MSILDKIMKPKSIAVIGASTNEHTIGSDIMKRLQEYNFNGKIYPVNPKGGIIEGLQAYTSITEVPGDVRPHHRSGSSLWQLLGKYPSLRV